MAKKQETPDEQQLKRELHETQKTCKYLQRQLKKAETKPPEKDPVIRRELEAAKQRIVELERILEVKRKQIEDYKEQAEQLDLAPDVLELRRGRTSLVRVSSECDVASVPAHVNPPQVMTMVAAIATGLGNGGLFSDEAKCDRMIRIMEAFLRDVAKRPLWEEAFDRVLADYCADGDD